MPSLSPAFDYFVRSCLSKNPDDRWQSAHDVLLELRLARAGARCWSRRRRRRCGRAAEERRLVRRVRGRPRRASPRLRCSCGPARRTRPGTAARFDVALPELARVRLARLARRVPDGQHLVFTARLQGKRQLWMRSLDGTVQPLADTEGATFPFWSPDSRRVAFFSGGKLKKVDVAGGPVTVLSDAYSVSRGAWGDRRHHPVRAAAERAHSRRVAKRAVHRGR